MKKILSLLLVTLLLATAPAPLAADAGPTVTGPTVTGPTVTVQIEDCDKNLFYGTVPFTQGMTALEAAMAALKQGGLDYVTSESPYGGKYFHSIAGRMESSFGGYDGWMYYVNGQSPLYSISKCPLEAGQHLLVAYADMDVLLPLVSAHRVGDTVQVEVSADVTAYDENWNATVTRQPIAGATVTADGAVYTADEAGRVTLSAQSAQKAQIALQVEKYAESGLSLVLRLAPDYLLTLPQAGFSDVDRQAPYAAAVGELTGRGIVKGYEDGTFRPQGAVTRAEAAAMLYRLADGAPVEQALNFTDVAPGKWYTDALCWAVANGVMQGFGDGTLRPQANVSRQDLAVMVENLRTKVLKAESDLTQAAPAFADNAHIAGYAAEPIYLLQKAGIIRAEEGDSFRPKAEALRSELCQWLYRLDQINK